MTRVMRCPTCNSRSPNFHPAVQSEGEVELCLDDWHEPSAAEIVSKWPAGSPYRRAVEEKLAAR